MYVLVGWSLFFGFLALTQRRYGNDLAATASVGFAMVGAMGARLLRERLNVERRLAALLVCALALLMFVPPLESLYYPWARRTVAKLRADEPRAIPPGTVGWSLHQFLTVARSLTPETRGYTNAAEVPEYGFVTHANLGHAVQWVARRATPTDPFWEYIGPQNWDRAFGMLGARDERVALAFAHELRARYVVAAAGAVAGGLSERLHTDDGLARPGVPAIAHFRHIGEGPLGGAGIHELGARHALADASPHDVPYKLFEVVEGARLEVATAPGAHVRASVSVRTATGREFRYDARARAGGDGMASLRLPYANEWPDFEPIKLAYRSRVAPVWELFVDARPAGELFVPEQAVLGGEVLRFDASSRSAPDGS